MRRSSAGSGIELTGGGRKRVLNGGVLRVKLAGEIGVGDHVVVRRERVALEAERADPDLGGEIDAGEGVEDGDAGSAFEGSVRERRDVGVATDRGDGGGERDHALAGFDLGARPHVPGHANSVHAFGIHLCHQIGNRIVEFGITTVKEALFSNPLMDGSDCFCLRSGLGSKFFFAFYTITSNRTDVASKISESTKNETKSNY